MEERFVKSKAMFMIFLIIAVSFTIANLDEVKAAENNVCCEVTESGDTCVYTDKDNCASDSLTANTACEQTSYCEPGVCLSDVGKCSEGVSKSTCESLDYEWYEGFSSDYDFCQKDCCVIADSEAAYTTENNCEYLIQGLEDIEKDFRDVDSEAECTEIVSSADKGCCVTSDACSYQTKGECESTQINLDEETGFYDEYCADLGFCVCEARDYTACVGEDVYWFDSCGNQEDVAEDCDYIDGTFCGADEEGEAYCASVDCSDTFDGVYSIDGQERERDTHDSKIGGDRSHGESWCLYESPAGDFKDRPGSQHYRSYCYFGEEIIEPCADFREEVCIQYPYEDEDGERGAACISNDNELFNPNITTVPKGADFWSGSDELATSCAIANVECPMTYVVTAYSDRQWEPGANLGCTSPQWARNMSLFCAAQGDCGASANIVEQFTSGGFSMAASQDWIGGDLAPNATDGEGEYRDKTYIGYDKCQDDDVEVDEETGERYCKEKDMKCLDQEGDGSVDCEFINTVEEIYSVNYDLFDDADFNKDWITDYSVRGGILGLEQVFGEGYSGFDSPSLWMPIIYATVNTAAVVTGLILTGVGTFTSAPFKIIYSTSDLIITETITGSTSTLGNLVNVGVLAAATSVIIVAVQVWRVNAEDNPLKALEKSDQYVIANAVGAGVSFLVYWSQIKGVETVAGYFGPWGYLVAVVVLAAAAINFSGGQSKDVSVNSYCGVWQPPSGIESCELCDLPVSEGGLAIDDGQGNILRGYECTEYKCKSLGYDCEFIDENVGSNRVKCVGSEINDVNHPVVIDAFLLGDYKDLDVTFDKDNSLMVNDEVEPYTFFEFGIELDEPGQCKIEYGVEPTETFTDMKLNFPDSYYDYVHNQSWILTPNEEYHFYIKCQDHKENYNIDSFEIHVETKSGDDITPPLIEATSVKTGGYISAAAESTPVSLFTNEPANCKYDSIDADYTLMDGYFACSGIPSSASALFDNECTAALNVTLGTNLYYFACEDAAGNINSENYEFSLIGTEPLNIDRVAPNGTLYYDSTSLYVETSVGAENGKAVCSYNNIEFFNTNAAVSTQPLQDLSAGDYDYDIECVDAGGNVNSTSISFTVEVDTDLPELTGLYITGDNVYYTLDEDTTCEYYYEEFDYGDGTSISGTFPLGGLETYYLACQDTFENEVKYTINV
ncbi:MAG: hypothetical protein Q8Q35_04740 [Nanoarchaeota archaeon]|nr:hypothetical protein [Nanoarchaeota archaeon]